MHSVRQSQRTATKRGIIGLEHVPRPIIVHTLTQSKDLLRHSLYNMTEFCCSWSTNVDAWWLRSPSWEVLVLNTTHQCFGRIQQEAKRLLWETLYATQFPTGCPQNVVLRPITGSGWGIDFSHVVDGLLQASTDKVTVDIVTPKDWQYARLGDVMACPSANPQCYFLPWTNCTAGRPRATIKGKARFHTPWRGFLPSSTDGNTHAAWLLEYATRAQTWLRREAVHLAANVQLPTPCVAWHVRRGDVVLHGNFSRRYHAISEYMNAWEKQQRNVQQQQQHPSAMTNVLLLTDDANAITEALSLHKSSYRWFYLRRPRHHGPEGGWENQIPSRDPRSEVVFLHAMFHLVGQCHALVHSKSNLADYLFAIMHLRHDDDDTPIRINLDEAKLHHQIHRAKNARTVQLSTKFAV